MLKMVSSEAVESYPVTKYVLCEVSAEKEGEFYVRVTVHRNKFLCNKTNQTQ
jgi:hypothetical protein